MQRVTCWKFTYFKKADKNFKYFCQNECVADNFGKAGGAKAITAFDMKNIELCSQ